jgi:hypothetical protein
VSRQIDQNDGIVAEQVVRSGERRHWWAVQLVVDQWAITQRIADAADRRDGPGVYPFSFSSMQMNRQAGEIQQAADMIPMGVRGQREIRWWHSG